MIVHLIDMKELVDESSKDLLNAKEITLFDFIKSNKTVIALQIMASIAIVVTNIVLTKVW